MSEFMDPIPQDGQGVAPQPVGRPVLLRQSREAAGLHIAALAAALKVPVKKLEALEAGRYEELPDLTFARALASSACRQLKIDPAPVLEQIPMGASPHLGDSSQAINAPFRPQQEVSSASPMAWLSRPAVWVTLVLLLAALVLVFWPSIQNLLPASITSSAESSGETVVVPGPANGDEPALAVTPLVLESSTLGAAPAAEAQPNSTSGGDSSAAKPEASALVLETGAATPNATALLSIAATGESWVEVVNGSGSVVMQRVLKVGDVIDFSTSPPYSVVLGRADAAKVMVRGKPFDIAPFARNNVARFEVK